MCKLDTSWLTSNTQHLNLDVLGSWGIRERPDTCIKLKKWVIGRNHEEFGKPTYGLPKYYPQKFLVQILLTADQNVIDSVSLLFFLPNDRIWCTPFIGLATGQHKGGDRRDSYALK